MRETIFYFFLLFFTISRVEPVLSFLNPVTGVDYQNFTRAIVTRVDGSHRHIIDARGLYAVSINNRGFLNIIEQNVFDCGYVFFFFVL
jgi:hypothetical protein